MKQAKDVDKFEPKGTQSDNLVNCGVTRTQMTAGRHTEPNPFLLITWNVVSPYIPQHNWESEPQGKPMDMRVKDSRKSESRSVMKRIEVETLPHTKVGRLLHSDSLQEIFRTFEKRKANERN